MRNKQKTREGMGGFTGSERKNVFIERPQDTHESHETQGKCARCQYFSGKREACNLVPCRLTGPGECVDCIHFLPVNKRRRKARCRWTGETLSVEDTRGLKVCAGFEPGASEGLTFAGAAGMVAVPKDVTRHSNRLSVLPRNGKSIAAYSAVEAPTISGSLLSHIGGEASSVFREGTAVLVTDRGGLFPRLFYSLNRYEVPHV